MNWAILLEKCAILVSVVGALGDLKGLRRLKGEQQLALRREFFSALLEIIFCFFFVSSSFFAYEYRSFISLASGIMTL
tara:strand:- start:90 stop:323 length:234 start_codon:yes stop_codon:yes gene_type:complete